MLYHEFPVSFVCTMYPLESRDSGHNIMNNMNDVRVVLYLEGGIVCDKCLQERVIYRERQWSRIPKAAHSRGAVFPQKC
jgi:hypothetical protein